MSFCLHHSKLFTRRTKFAQLPCLPLANKFPPKLSIWRVKRPNKVRVPPKLYPIKSKLRTANLKPGGAGDGKRRIWCYNFR